MTFLATSQRPIFAKFGHDTWIVDETQILEINLWKVSIQASFAPRNPKLGGGQTLKQAPHQSRAQATGQEMHCREILFTPRCKGQGVSEVWSTFLYNVLRSYGASKLPNFRILAYFPHTKRLETYLPVTSLQPRGRPLTFAEWFQFFHVVV